VARQSPQIEPEMVTPENIPEKPETPDDASQGESTHVEVEIDSLHMRVGLDLPPGAKVRFSVTDTNNNKKHSFEVVGPGEPRAQSKSKWVLSGKLKNYWDRLIQWLTPFKIELWLLAAGLLIYMLVRLIGLVNYPIYFFTDEAIQTTSAIDLVKNSFRSPEGILLPTFFKNGPYYNLGLSVYLQIIPYLLFGKSVFITRAVSVFFSIIAAVSISLTLRNIFSIKYWWAGVLVLSFVPSWFLHSRTAFETVIFVSCYAGFLYCYLMYRCRSPRYLYLVLVMAGLAFYSYSPGQLVIAATGIALLLLDVRYHWENRKMTIKVLITLVLIALPYLRFRLGSTFSPEEHLQLLNSYWVQPITLSEKLSRFWAEYSRGVSPYYWFIPNNHDLERHLMKGYGNLPIFTLPFFAVGLILTVLNIRKPAYRVLLVALLAAPLGSALVGIGITRVLVFIVPATILIVIGIGYCLDWLEKGFQSLLSKRSTNHAGKNTLSTWISIGLFWFLVLANILSARDALVNGPLWFNNYGLSGMQYGASQLFPAVIDYQKSHPIAHVIISPNWANGTDVVARFFSNVDGQFDLGSIEGHLIERKPLDENTVFVMIPEDYNKTISSGKFTDIKIDETLPYPDGQTGFYFVRLRYGDNVDEIFSAEKAARNALQHAEVMIDGDPVQVQYSMLDMGSIDLVFDGNKDTVARTLEANPFVIELTFPEERLFSGYKMVLGSADTRVSAILYSTEDGQPAESVADFDGSPSNPELDVNFGQTIAAKTVRFEVFQPYSGVPSNVHVWEIEFK
jgi:4-amino-4-deoxy-L-arabinose transferase-like glycosyltransferase